MQISYKTKAKQDVQEVSKLVDTVLESLGLAPGSIPSEEIETFCKYSAFLKVIRYRSLEDEYTQPKTKQIGNLPILTRITPYVKRRDQIHVYLLLLSLW